MISKEFIVKSEHGLHARPADLFVRTANSFPCTIKVKNLTTNSSDVNAKSILRILTLGVNYDHKIKIQAEGDRELEAIEAFSKLIEANFEA